MCLKLYKTYIITIIIIFVAKYWITNFRSTQVQRTNMQGLEDQKFLLLGPQLIDGSTSRKKRYICIDFCDLVD
jgi:hypothetical protein